MFLSMLQRLRELVRLTVGVLFGWAVSGDLQQDVPLDRGEDQQCHRQGPRLRFLPPFHRPAGHLWLRELPHKQVRTITITSNSCSTLVQAGELNSPTSEKQNVFRAAMTDKGFTKHRPIGFHRSRCEGRKLPLLKSAFSTKFADFGNVTDNLLGDRNFPQLDTYFCQR